MSRNGRDKLALLELLRYITHHPEQADKLLARLQPVEIKGQGHIDGLVF